MLSQTPSNETAAVELVNAALRVRFVEIGTPARDDTPNDLAQRLERAIEAAMDLDDADAGVDDIARDLRVVLDAIHTMGWRVEVEHAEREVQGIVGRMTLPGLVLSIVPA